MERVHIAICWCGSVDLKPFTEHYLQCQDCGTLINSPRLPDACFAGGTGEDHFYGKQYWLTYQQEKHGLPDIVQRARDDLAERCLYWLATILKYKCPPGRSLELGCAHGGLVALMKMAGFEAMGVELSPWVADYAAKTFDVPVHSGTVADLEIEPESMDCVILMDVLEHLVDPRATLHSIVRALKPDGITVIQTPAYRDNGPDWEMLIDQEHLYLFTEDGLRRLLFQVGLHRVERQPQLFPHDMFLIAGQAPLPHITRQAVETSLLQAPTGRLLLAMLDVHTHLLSRQEEWQQRMAASEADRAARLDVIEEQGRRLGTLQADRNVLEAELNTLRQHFQASEADRAARLTVIEEQGRQLGILQGEKERATQALLAISRTRAYRFLRWLGRWRWVEQALTPSSSASPAQTEPK